MYLSFAHPKLKIAMIQLSLTLYTMKIVHFVCSSETTVKMSTKLDRNVYFWCQWKMGHGHRGQ